MVLHTLPFRVIVLSWLWQTPRSTNDTSATFYWNFKFYWSPPRRARPKPDWYEVNEVLRPCGGFTQWYIHVCCCLSDSCSILSLKCINIPNFSFSTRLLRNPLKIWIVPANVYLLNFSSSSRTELIRKVKQVSLYNWAQGFIDIITQMLTSRKWYYHNIILIIH